MKYVKDCHDSILLIWSTARADVGPQGGPRNHCSAANIPKMAIDTESSGLDLVNSHPNMQLSPQYHNADCLDHFINLVKRAARMCGGFPPGILRIANIPKDSTSCDSLLYN